MERVVEMGLSAKNFCSSLPAGRQVCSGLSLILRPACAGPELVEGRGILPAGRQALQPCSLSSLS